MRSELLTILLKYIGDPNKAMRAANEILLLKNDDITSTDADEKVAIEYLKRRYPNQEEWHYRDAVMAAGLERFNNTNYSTIYKTNHDIFVEIACLHLIKLEQMSKREG